MANNNLILRTLISPWITPTPDITKSSVLKHIDVDNNFIYLRGELIYSATTIGNLVTLKKINGNDLSFNVGSGGGSDYWTSGSTGFYSIKTVNDSGLDATGNYCVAQGFNTLASGSASHAGGNGSVASGLTSFIHSTNSLVTGDRSVVLGGQNITGATDDTVYVPNLNINNIGGTTSVTNLGIDSNGNVVSGTTGGPSIDIYNTYFVSPNGDDTTAVRGDLAKPYQTITAARNQVVADLSASTVTGDTLVYVYPGEYEEVELQYDNGNMYFERGAKVKPFFPPSGSSVDYYKLFIVGSSLDLQSNVYSANTFNTYGYLDVEIPRNEDLGYLWGGYLLDVDNSGKCYFEFNNVDIDAGQGFRANGNGELTLVGNEINVGFADYCMQFTDYSITNVNVNRIIGGTSNFAYATSLSNFRGNCNVNIRELLGRWRGIGLTNMYEGETNINISSGRFETLSGSSNEFIWVTDFDGGIARINGSVTSNTGLIRMNRCDAGVLEVNVDYTTYGAGSVVNQIVGSNSTPNFTFKYNGDVRVSGNTGARFNLDDCTNYINGSISSLDGLISTPISNGLNSDLFIENLTIKDVDGDPIIGSGDINVLGGLYVENSLSAVTINGQYQILDKTSIDRLEIRDVQSGTSITNLGIDSNGNVVSGTTGAPAFTGNTSGDCITDLYVTNIHGCSPITIKDDLILEGDLTILGTATTVNIKSEDVYIADNFVLLNSNVSGGTPTQNSGIDVRRGDQPNGRIVWNETDDRWEVGTSGTTYEVITTNNIGSFTGNTLQEVLVNGNVSSGNNMIISDDDILQIGSSDPTWQFSKNSVNGRLEVYNTDEGFITQLFDQEYFHSQGISGREWSFVGPAGYNDPSFRVRIVAPTSATQNTLLIGSAGLSASTFSGLTYLTDYSSNFTNRSLVDKEYVDNTVSGATIWSQSGSSIYYNDGNVGIGTSNPTYNLDVVSSGGTGSYEDIARFRTIDSTDYLALTNAISTDGTFNPVLRSFNNTNVSTNFYLQSVIDPSVDTGVNPLIMLQGRVSTDPGNVSWSGVTTRPIVRVRNNSTNLLDVTADGKVGIGTIAPSDILEVTDGTSTFATNLDNSNGPLVSVVTSDTDSLIRFGATDGVSSINIGTVGTTYSGIQSFGAPSDSYIYSNSSANGINIISQTGTGTGDYIRFYAGGNPFTSTASIHIQGSGSTKGNVGIGTETPNSKLEVSGTTGNLQVKLDNDNGNNTNQLLLTSDEPTYINYMSIGSTTPNAELLFGIIGPSNVTNDVGSTDDSFILATSASDNMNFINNAGVGTTDKIGFYAGKTLGTNLSTTTPDLVILGSGSTRGYVGLGNDTPTEKLDVVGNTKISGTLNIGTLGTGTSVNNLGIDSSGNVVDGNTNTGIYGGDGTIPLNTTASVNGNLTFQGLDEDTRIILKDGNNGGEVHLFSDGNVGQSALEFYNPSGVTLTSKIQNAGGKTRFISNNRDLVFTTNTSVSTEGLFIEAGTGNVGVRTTTPTEKLDVVGNTKISGTLNIGTLGTGTSVNNLGIDSSGNIVSGNIVSGSTGPDSITFEIFNTSPASPDPYTIYDDGNIRLLFDEAATDDIEIVILTNPSTGPVHVVWSEPTGGTSGSANVTTASGQVPLNTEVSADDVVDFVIWAPEDSTYPYYEAKVTVSNGTFTSIPAVARVSKWNTPS